jgi:hypothetical protein
MRKKKKTRFNKVYQTTNKTTPSLPPCLSPPTPSGPWTQIVSTSSPSVGHEVSNSSSVTCVTCQILGFNKKKIHSGSCNPDPLHGHPGLRLVEECLLSKFLVLKDLVLSDSGGILWQCRWHSGLGRDTGVVPVRWQEGLQMCVLDGVNTRSLDSFGCDMSLYSIHLHKLATLIAICHPHTNYQ